MKILILGKNNNLILARIREELVKLNNTKKEDRVIITGLVSKPTIYQAQISWMITTNLFNLQKKPFDLTDKKLLMVNKH
jgi:hypothetical protein